MYIATIDCGTTNTRVYIVDENGSVIARASKKVGVRDTAISGSNQLLKDGILELFDHALTLAGIKATEIHCVLSSGVITSELGLLEIPHLPAPCNINILAQNLVRLGDDTVFPKPIPFYLIPGIKNPYDPKTASVRTVGVLDAMRGEETQVAGFLDGARVKLPCIFTMLSSHTKYIAIDENQNILGLVTTLSGQIYEALMQQSFVGKSLRREDGLDNTDYFDPLVVDAAQNEIRDFGLLRGLVSIRFLDILLHNPWYERKLFAESLLASDDMKSLDQLQVITGLESSHYVLVGQPTRCKIYQHLLRQSQKNSNLQFTIIDKDTEIDQLSIRGALSLAKKAGII